MRRSERILPPNDPLTIRFRIHEFVGWPEPSEVQSVTPATMASATPYPSYKGGDCSPSHCLIMNLLPEAEIREDHIEQLLNIGPAGDAAEAAPGEAQILRAKLR